MAASARPDNGDQRKDIEAWLDENGATWEFVPHLPLKSIDRKKSLENQARLHDPLDAETVAEYREAMRRGDRFPAIVVARSSAKANAVNIDGNHRFEAATLADLTTFGAYVVSTRPNSNLMTILASTANGMHGKPTALEDRIQHGIWFIDARGLGVDSAAAKVNLPASTLRTRYEKLRADRRADEVGVRRSDWDSLLVTARTRLLSIGTDEGFKAGARLAIAARLSTTQVDELVSAVNEFPKSASKQEQIVRALRRDYADRIEQVASGQAPSKASGFTPRKRFNLALTNLISLPQDFAASLAGSFDDKERAAAAHQAHEAAAKLEELAAALES